MSEYNQAIEDAATLIESNNGPQPCDCCYFDPETGYWHSQCQCYNSGDLEYAASWCCSANEAARVRRLKR